jgi:hypothetical protein
VTEADYRWLDLYKHYTQGHLWAPGGVASQPAIYLDAMKTIDLGMRIAAHD